MSTLSLCPTLFESGPLVYAAITHESLKALAANRPAKGLGRFLKVRRCGAGAGEDSWTRAEDCFR